MTKLEPEFSYFQCDLDNYEICDDKEIKKLDPSKENEIFISDNQKFTFMETKFAAHKNYDFTGKVAFIRSSLFRVNSYLMNSIRDL